MTFTKRKISAPRKSGNKFNNKNISYSREIYSPSSKRSYYRKYMKSNLKNDIKQNNSSLNININNSAFLTNSQGDERTEVAARQKKSRDVKRLKEMILDKKNRQSNCFSSSYSFN